VLQAGKVLARFSIGEEAVLHVSFFLGRCQPSPYFRSSLARELFND